MPEPDLMRPEDVQESDPEAEALENENVSGGRSLELVSEEAEEETSSQPETPAVMPLDMLPPDLRQMAEENPQQAATVIHNALNLARGRLEDQEKQRKAEAAQQSETAQAQAEEWFRSTYEQEFQRSMEASGLTQYSSQADIQKAQQQAHLHALDAATTMKAGMLIDAKLQEREQTRLRREAFLNDPANEDLMPHYKTLQRLINEGHDPNFVAAQLRQIEKDRIKEESVHGEVPGLNAFQNRQLRERLNAIQNPIANRGATPRTTKDQRKAQREATRDVAEMFWGKKLR